MAENFRYNVIRFKGRALMLDGTFVFKAGLEPDVNSFVCAYDDFEELQRTAADPGDLEFFYNRDRVGGDAGGTSDFRIRNMRMVSWSPLEVGSTLGANPRIGPIKYRIRLADFRERFVHPRGGWLRFIELVNDKSNSARLSNADLMNRCLAKMGVGASLPAAVDAIPAPTDLKWYGAHAPKELEELLDRTGAVICPSREIEQFRVEMIGEGSAPEAPADQRLPTVTLSGQDRRGRTVIFTSHPNAIIERIKLDGPSDDNWQYVAPDPADFNKWKKLEDIADLQPDPHAKFLAGFPDSVHHDWWMGYVYRCLRLNPEKHGNTPILRLARRWHRDPATGAGVVDDVTIRVEAKVFLEGKDGKVKNAEVKALVPPASIAGGTVLKFSRLMMKLDVDTPLVPEIRDRLVPLDDHDLTITFGREEPDRVTKELKYFQAGYRANDLPGGEPVELSDSDVKGLLASGDRDVVVVERPDWVLYKENNEYTNLPTLKAAAKAAAARLLQGSGEPAEIRSAVGFVPIDLSGKVAEIRITQEPPKTEWKVNTWWLPQEANLSRLRKKSDAKAATEAQPSQGKTQGERQALGADGEVQPEVILNPTPIALPAGGTAVLVKITADLPRGGCYRANVVGDFGDLDPMADGAMRLTSTSGEEVAFVHVDENELNTHWLAPFTYGVGRLQRRPPTTEGSVSTPTLPLVIGFALSAKPQPGHTIATDGVNAEPTTWSRAKKGDKGLEVALQTRTVYDAAGTQALYAFQRTLKLDARGFAFSLSAETRVDVDQTVECEEAP
jgi:hypothetical protein